MEIQIPVGNRDYASCLITGNTFTQRGGTAINALAGEGIAILSNVIGDAVDMVHAWDGRGVVKDNIAVDNTAGGSWLNAEIVANWHAVNNYDLEVHE